MTFARRIGSLATDRNRRFRKPIGKLCEIRRRVALKLKRVSRCPVFDERLMLSRHLSKKLPCAAVVNDAILPREHHQHR